MEATVGNIKSAIEVFICKDTQFAKDNLKENIQMIGWLLQR